MEHLIDKLKRETGKRSVIVSRPMLDKMLAQSRETTSYSLSFAPNGDKWQVFKIEREEKKPLPEKPKKEKRSSGSKDKLRRANDQLLHR